ncbi:MAG: class II D-tagatose-bisphosphate aldolase, non-catalytic subunit [Bacteroidales bacterium]|nr:class II D-tagatose-bisphosphate aldolase, non-catalytic subunit [Bacteroidales bacterium]
MNTELRNNAKAAGLSLMEYILKQIGSIEQSTKIPRTILAACPNSLAVIKSALLSAKRCNAPIKFAATLNQVDTDGGYTGLTAKEFVDTIREEARFINFTGPVIVAIDHGGPWLKDKHRVENWPYEKTMAEVKTSFEEAIKAGYDLIHVDPTIDITLPKGKTIDIDVVAERTIELIVHCEDFRRKNNFDKIAYEVGTEEVHGGLADMGVFSRFLNLLKAGLQKNNLHDVWPCFIVGKVGTDLHTTTFDAKVARLLTETVRPYGSKIKGHYSDNVDNPEEYPLSGMGAANVGPEFTECEYDGLLELDGVEQKLLGEGKIVRASGIKKSLWDAVIESGRWTKWLSREEEGFGFGMLHPKRQEWLVKTGCRYIWEKPEVIAARTRLYTNMKNNGIDADKILITHIEKSMDRYFNKFNLVDLNKLLK